MSGEAIALILGGLGSLAGILLAGFKAFREGATTRQRHLMEDLEEARGRAEHDRRQEAILRRYWERRCGEVDDARRRGTEPPPSDPPAWVDYEARRQR